MTPAGVAGGFAPAPYRFALPARLNWTSSLDYQFTCVDGNLCAVVPDDFIGHYPCDSGCPQGLFGKLT